MMPELAAHRARADAATEIRRVIRPQARAATAQEMSFMTSPATSSGVRSLPASSSTKAKLVNAWSVFTSRASSSPDRLSTALKLAPALVAVTLP